MSSLTMPNKISHIFNPKIVFFGLALALGATVLCWKKFSPVSSVAYLGRGQEVLTKESLAKALNESTSFYHCPTEMEIPGLACKAVLQYSFDPQLQEEMETLFKQYRPDYGAFVAMDAATGQILSIVSFSEKSDMTENMAFRASFPT